MLGGEAGAFLRMGLGADRVAMGDCGVALSNSSVTWFYNPAALAFQTNKQAALGYRWMSLDRSIMYAGFSRPIKPNGGLAIGIIRAGIDNIEGRDSNGEKFDEFSWSDNVIHGSFALMPHPMLGLGISIKWIINAVPDIKENDKNLYAYGLGVDLGVRVIPMPGLRLGLQLRDLDAKHSWETSDVWGEDTGTNEDQLPTQIRIGAAWDPINDLTVASDIVMYSQLVGDDDDALQIHFGVEWKNLFGVEKEPVLRFGYNGRAPTFGLGFKFDISQVITRLDYAFLLEPESPGGSHLAVWVFEF